MTTEDGPPAGEPGGELPGRGRRRIPWTRALWVSLVGFAVWLLLFAPTLQRNAQASPVGTRRSVSLAILGPIATMSRVLQVSHVVSVADGVIGKGGGTGVHSAVSSLGPPVPRTPPPTAPHPATSSTVPVGAPTTTTVPLYREPTAANPLRVLIIGDSLGLDLGQALQADLAGTGVVNATLDGKESTGLTRPDYFNWPAELQADLPRYNPEVVVIMMGANDPQDFPGPPDIPYGTPQWDQIYTQRVQSFMAEAASGGAKVLWVGQPPMATPGRSAAMVHLDGIYQAQAAQNPAVTYLSSTAVLGTPQGQYTPYLTINGTQEQVRTTDGTHLAPAGSELLAQSVMTAMRNQLHIALPGG